MTILRRQLLAGAAGLVAAGCADIVGPLPAPKLYTLSPKLPAPVLGNSIGFALAVETPETTAGLDTMRIAISRPPSGFDFYADAAWSDRVPRLIQSGMIEALETSARSGAVARDSDGIRADFILNSDLRSFEVRFDQGEGAPLAVVRIGFRLIDARSRKIAAATVLEKDVRASANTVDAGVAALTEAFSGVLDSLVPWVMTRR
jgi:ABC-type uncharacterized transport system, auxiliary component